jgi:hypothetical protein
LRIADKGAQILGLLDNRQDELSVAAIDFDPFTSIVMKSQRGSHWTKIGAAHGQQYGRFGCVDLETFLLEHFHDQSKIEKQTMQFSQIMKQTRDMKIVCKNVQVSLQPSPVNQVRKVSQIEQNKRIEQPWCCLAALPHSSSYPNRGRALGSFNMIGSVLMPLR